MTDTVAIVKRLRERANFYLESKGNSPHYYSFDAAVDLEAADEIERLQSALIRIVNLTEGIDELAKARDIANAALKEKKPA